MLTLKKFWYWPVLVFALVVLVSILGKCSGDNSNNKVARVIPCDQLGNEAARDICEKNKGQVDTSAQAANKPVAGQN